MRTLGKIALFVVGITVVPAVAYATAIGVIWLFIFLNSITPYPTG